MNNKQFFAVGLLLSALWIGEAQGMERLRNFFGLKKGATPTPQVAKVEEVEVEEVEKEPEFVPAPPEEAISAIPLPAHIIQSEIMKYLTNPKDIRALSKELLLEAAKERREKPEFVKQLLERIKVRLVRLEWLFPFTDSELSAEENVKKLFVNSVVVLKKFKPFVDQKNASGETALIWVARVYDEVEREHRGRMNPVVCAGIIAGLIKAGADESIIDNSGKTYKDYLGERLDSVLQRFLPMKPQVEGEATTQIQM